jgi:hypothetical protein
MYKAKCNIFCENRYYEAGKIYSKKEITGLDVNDFELVDEKEPKEEKPKSMTNKTLKAKK